MRVFKSKEDSLMFWLSFFLLAGCLIGVLFCNGMTAEMKLDWITVWQEDFTRSTLKSLEFQELLIRILPKRIWSLVLLLMAATTPMANWYMRLAAGYFGFSNAVMICALTMSFGVGGIFRYAALMFPQAILYGFAGYLILWWMPAKEKHLTVSSVIFVAGLVCEGSVLEAFVNPWILNIF